jgi:hypothetical protein
MKESLMATIPLTSSVVQDIVDSSDERELWIVGREFERPPYFIAGKGGDTRLTRALRLCADDKITPNSDGSYQVEGSAGRSYRVADSCSCPNSQKASTKWCYHAVGVALYVEWQRRLHPRTPEQVALGTLRPGTLPFPPTTVDERLANTRRALDTMNDAAAAVRLGTIHDSTALSTHHTPQEDRMPDDEYMPEPDNYEHGTTAGLDVSAADFPPMGSPATRPLPGPVLLPSLALPLRSIQAIIADLSRPLPADCVATKTQGGTAIAYLHWQTVARVLDAYAPGWDGQVTRIDHVGNTCAITYRLTIPCLEGTVSREATGQEEAEVKGYGDATSNAEAMAMKRAAAKFGLGAWLYDKDTTAPALAAHLTAEKTQALAALGTRLDTLGRDRSHTLAWLKTQTGATRTRDIPLGAIQALLLHLAQEAPCP